MDRDWSGEETMMQLIDGASVWTRRDVRPEEFRIDLSAACLDEIRRAADEIRAYPLPTILRAPSDFAMPACRRRWRGCGKFSIAAGVSR
jgi:hypothetical protein